MKQKKISNNGSTANSINEPQNPGQVLASIQAENHAQQAIDYQLSLKECKTILSSGGTDYSDDEVVAIRRVLYSLAEVDYKYHNQVLSQEPRASPSQQQVNSSAIVIPLNSAQNSITDDLRQKSYSLRPCKYRRAG